MNGYFEQFSAAILDVIRSFDGELTLTFIEYGTHENFYRDLKNKPYLV